MKSSLNSNPNPELRAEELLVSARLQVNARNLHCPMPLLKAKQALQRCETGQRVAVLATDAGALRDIPAFCQLAGHIVVLAEKYEDLYRFVIEKRETQT